MRAARLIAASAAILLVAPVGAQEATGKVANAPAKMICKKFEGTGTRLKNRRVCASEEQWRQREKEDQDLLVKIQDNSRLKTTE